MYKLLQDVSFTQETLGKFTKNCELMYEVCLRSANEMKPVEMKWNKFERNWLNVNENQSVRNWDEWLLNENSISEQVCTSLFSIYKQFINISCNRFQTDLQTSALILS